MQGFCKRRNRKSTWKRKKPGNQKVMVKININDQVTEVAGIRKKAKER